MELHCKAGHTWIKIQLVQQGLPKFRSTYGLAGCAEANQLISAQPAFWGFPDWSVPLATAGNIDYCIMMARKSPCCQITIPQQEGFSHPLLMRRWGNRIIWVERTKKKKKLSMYRPPNSDWGESRLLQNVLVHYKGLKRSRQEQ